MAIVFEEDFTNSGADVPVDEWPDGPGVDSNWTLVGPNVSAALKVSGTSDCVIATTDVSTPGIPPATSNANPNDGYEHSNYKINVDRVTDMDGVNDYHFEADLRYQNVFQSSYLLGRIQPGYNYESGYVLFMRNGYAELSIITVGVYNWDTGPYLLGAVPIVPTAEESATGILRAMMEFEGDTIRWGIGETQIADPNESTDSTYPTGPPGFGFKTAYIHGIFWPLPTAAQVMVDNFVIGTEPEPPPPFDPGPSEYRSFGRYMWRSLDV